MEQIALIILTVWTLVLSVAIFLQYRFFNNLTSGSGEKDLIKVLKKNLEKAEVNSRDIQRIYKEIMRIDEQSVSHVQRLGIVRFNPFQETGGDHSFSLALLDGKNSGFIITGLHTRERTRVYLKEVRRGKSNMELSNEEIKAFERAQKKLDSNENI